MRLVSLLIGPALAAAAVPATADTWRQLEAAEAAFLDCIGGEEVQMDFLDDYYDLWEARGMDDVIAGLCDAGDRDGAEAASIAFDDDAHATPTGVLIRDCEADLAEAVRAHVEATVENPVSHICDLPRSM